MFPDLVPDYVGEAHCLPPRSHSEKLRHFRHLNNSPSPEGAEHRFGGIWIVAVCGMVGEERVGVMVRFVLFLLTPSADSKRRDARKRTERSGVPKADEQDARSSPGLVDWWFGGTAFTPALRGAGGRDLDPMPMRTADGLCSGRAESPKHHSRG